MEITLHHSKVIGNECIKVLGMPSYDRVLVFRTGIAIHLGAFHFRVIGAISHLGVILQKKTRK